MRDSMWSRLKSKGMGGGSKWACAFPISISAIESLGWKFTTSFGPGSTNSELLWGPKNGAGVKQNFSVIRKLEYARNEGDVICVQTEDQSTGLIHTGLDRCVQTESLLSLRAKQNDRWQNMALERKGENTELLLRLVASFIKGWSVVSVAHSAEKAWGLMWGLLTLLALSFNIETDLMRPQQFLGRNGVTYIQKKIMVKTFFWKSYISYGFGWLSKWVYLQSIGFLIFFLSMN